MNGDLARFERRITKRLDELEYHIGAGIYAIALLIINEGNRIMADLTRLTNEVAENTDAVQSAITLLGELAQLLRDASGDADAVNALADQLDANSQQLAEAVAANTPAEPPVEEPPVEEPPVEPPV